MHYKDKEIFEVVLSVSQRTMLRHELVQEWLDMVVHVSKINSWICFGEIYYRKTGLELAVGTTQFLCKQKRNRKKIKKFNFCKGKKSLLS